MDAFVHSVGPHPRDNYAVDAPSDAERLSHAFRNDTDGALGRALQIRRQVQLQVKSSKLNRENMKMTVEASKVSL